MLPRLDDKNLLSDLVRRGGGDQTGDKNCWVNDTRICGFCYVVARNRGDALYWKLGFLNIILFAMFDHNLDKFYHKND